MPTIVSTLSNAVNFKDYAKPQSGAAAVRHSVLINGGANVAQRKLVILGDGPAAVAGIATQVTGEQLTFLEGHKDFQAFVKTGHLKVVKAEKVKAEKVAAEMTPADASAPLTEKDSEKGGRLAVKPKAAKKVE